MTREQKILSKYKKRLLSDIAGGVIKTVLIFEDRTILIFQDNSYTICDLYSIDDDLCIQDLYYHGLISKKDYKKADAERGLLAAIKWREKGVATARKKLSQL